MLDFLGLQEEAVKVFVCLFIIAIVMGFPLGAASAKKSTDKLGVSGVFGIIGIIISLISLFIGAWPLFMLFITFQWKWIIFAVIGAAILFGICFLIARAGTTSARIRKYKKNPVVKEAVSLVKENGYVGVQCHRDCIRFYFILPNSQYCKSHTEIRVAENDMQCCGYENSDFRPDCWKEYDNSIFIKDRIDFSSRHFPPLDELDLFARALASSIGGCKVTTHKAYIKYTGYHKSRSTGEYKNAHHYIYNWDDRFVVKKNAVAKTKKNEKNRPKPDKKEKEPVSKPNTWD